MGLGNTVKRVTEPELMLSPDQVRAYAGADFSSMEDQMISSLVMLAEKNNIPIGNDTLILDLGCGPGNISEKLSYCWPNANVIGIDDSSEMLKIARQRNTYGEKKIVLKRLAYIKMNLFKMAKGHSQFMKSADIVVSNSLLHHIHDPFIFFKTLINISKKGTLHFHRDLRRPSSPEEVLSIQQKHLSKAPSVLIRDFQASLHAAFTLDEVEDEISKAGINGLNVVEVEDRYIDIEGTVF